MRRGLARITAWRVKPVRPSKLKCCVARQRCFMAVALLAVWSTWWTNAYRRAGTRRSTGSWSARASTTKNWPLVPVKPASVMSPSMPMRSGVNKTITKFPASPKRAVTKPPVDASPIPMRPAKAALSVPVICCRMVLSVCRSAGWNGNTVFRAIHMADMITKLRPAMPKNEFLPILSKTGCNCTAS